MLVLLLYGRDTEPSKQQPETDRHTQRERKTELAYPNLHSCRRWNVHLHSGCWQVQTSLFLDPETADRLEHILSRQVLVSIV